MLEYSFSSIFIYSQQRKNLSLKKKHLTCCEWFAAYYLNKTVLVSPPLVDFGREKGKQSATLLGARAHKVQ
jgi:hypothetical protein